MKRAWNPKRRRFLQGVAASAAGSVACSRTPTSPWLSFSVEEARIVEAICDQIIPDDEEFPGAVWAGALNYIDRQLAGPLRKHRPAYREGLEWLEKTSILRFGAGFSTLTDEAKVQLMSDVERGEGGNPEWPSALQMSFFRMVIDHTMQSYYGDPRHGGNKDQVGYRLLGIPITCIRGREHHDLTQIKVGGES